MGATSTVAPTRSRRPRRRRRTHAAGVLSTRRRPQLDELAARWRVALNAADEALSAAARSGFEGLGAAELGRRRRRLEQERLATDRLLGAVAHETRTRLRRSLSAPRATARMLGLPTGTLACLFDLDGVLTPTARLHGEAWAATFDELLARRAGYGERFSYLTRPFDPRRDYSAYLHGRPRLDGARAFLASRSISLPDGSPQDPPGTESVHGVANRKNELLQRLLARKGVAAFEGSRLYLEEAREAGVLRAIVSASANTRAILARAGLDGLADAVVDGTTMEREGLRAKPAPDVLLAACDALGVAPSDCVDFETTEAGIAGAAAAGIPTVVAVDRLGRLSTLRAVGATVVVSDLAALLDPALEARPAQ